MPCRLCHAVMVLGLFGQFLCLVRCRNKDRRKDKERCAYCNENCPALSTCGRKSLEFRIHNTDWEPVDHDGIKLVRRNFPKTEENDHKSTKAMQGHIQRLSQRKQSAANDKLGFTPRDYFIFACTGSDDIAHGNMVPQINAMKQDTKHFVYTSDFSKGNFYFLVASPEKTHWWGFVRHYIYDGLPYFFHENQ